MLREIENVKQHRGEPRRRWFVDDFFDLIVWVDKHKDILGFQLCYDKPKRQHALTWHKGTGFMHNRVDDGEHKPGKPKATPVLVADGRFDADSIADAFERESPNMDKELARFVCSKIREYHDS